MGLTYAAVLFDLFGTLVDDEGNAFDGVIDMLSELPSDRWAIVTSCSRRLADALIARSGLPQPRAVITADDVARGKPAPDGYLLAASRLRVEAARSLVVEDSPQGIAAARTAGMDVVAVLRGRDAAFAAAAPFTVERAAALVLRAGSDGITFDG